jgi:5-methylthioribose kinase
MCFLIVKYHVGRIAGHRIAPEGIEVWNPGFDVTPCELITGIITEVGVISASDLTRNDDPEINSKDGTIDTRIIDVPAFLRAHGKAHLCGNAVEPNFAPVGYRYMNSSRIAEMCANTPKIAAQLGLTSGDSINASLLHVTEVGDGNLNFVYIVKSSESWRAVVIKQALPFVRCVGDSWPLSLDRAAFEQQALIEHRGMSPEHVPEVYLYDASTALIAMEYIAPPNAILRKVMMAKRRLPLLASHLSLFMARTLFKSSILALNGPMIREKVAFWSKNIQMCALTEQVIFTDPFIDAKYNNWTKPFLDSFVMHLRGDVDVLLAAAELKMKFVSCAQALLHGDLHTGSIMACEESTYVIDPEFAFYGPIGFDTGSVLANLMMSYFSQPGHPVSTPEEEAYPEWILTQIQSIYELFAAEFVRLWDEAHHSKEGVSGFAFSGGAFHSKDVFAVAQANFMRTLWWDTLGFMGIEMVRRVVGIAHVADLKEISDDALRADCEKRVLALARLLMLVSSEPWRRANDSLGEVVAKLSSPAGLVDVARRIQCDAAPSTIVVSM